MRPQLNSDVLDYEPTVDERRDDVRTIAAWWSGWTDGAVQAGQGLTFEQTKLLMDDLKLQLSLLMSL